MTPAEIFLLVVVVTRIILMLTHNQLPVGWGISAVVTFLLKLLLLQLNLLHLVHLLLLDYLLYLLFSHRLHGRPICSLLFLRCLPGLAYINLKWTLSTLLYFMLI